MGELASFGKVFFPAHLTRCYVPTSMIVNGLTLPMRFVDAVKTRRFNRSRGSWQLREDCDSYGNRLEAELGEVYRTAKQIKVETDRLATHFQANGCYGESLADFAGPGAIPDILDFSQIICFGISGGGEPFCFDYRKSEEHPSVIWWDDVYWRKVSPDFDSFLELFDLTLVK